MVDLVTGKTNCNTDSAQTNFGPDQDMMRSLNLIPTQNIGNQPTSSTSTSRQSLEPSQHLEPESLLAESSNHCGGISQNIRSDTPESDSSLDSITIKVETMEHPVLATDAEMDDAIEDIHGSKGMIENDKEKDQDHDVGNEVNEEERALSAMSILSHDSDDDPTWAPSGAEKSKLESKKKGKTEKVIKFSFNDVGRKGTNSFPANGSKSSGIHTKAANEGKKGRGRPRNIKIRNLQDLSPKKSPQASLKYRKTTNTTQTTIKTSKNSKISTKAVNKLDANQAIASSSDEESIDLSEKANRIEGAGGNDFHYFCRICQISFFRYNAFKHHMNNSKEQHKKLKAQKKAKKELDLEYHCKECCIAFPDRKSYQRHMSDEHQSLTDHQYHCQKCDVHLKSESAFKSHNSKLHLERREKTYYCRECDETFSCLIKHSLHIVVHRTWTEENMGMQCRICGKVFTRNQTLPFHRHLATHDSEPETKCSCHNCLESEKEDDGEDNDDPEVTFNVDNIIDKSSSIAIDRNIKKDRKRSHKYCAENNESFIGSTKENSTLRSFRLLESTKKKLPDRDQHGEEDNTVSLDEDDDALRPFECGFCNKKFCTVETLENHVENIHNEPEKNTTVDSEHGDGHRREVREISSDVIDEVTDEFADEVAAFEAAEEKIQKQIDAKRAKFEEKKNGGKVMMVTMVKKTGKIVVGGKRPVERNWQECPARNWAAEFGYGGITSGSTSNQSFISTSTGSNDQCMSSGSLVSQKMSKTDHMNGIPSSKLEGGDLLSKMRATFRKDDEDESEDLIKGEGDQMFRSRGLKGTIKASPGKAPRTLSSSSLRTRQRMEALMKRARDFMKQNRKQKLKAKQREEQKDKGNKVLVKNLANKDAKLDLANKKRESAGKLLALRETNMKMVEVSQPGLKNSRRRSGIETEDESKAKQIEGKHNSSILASSNQNTKRERSPRKIKEVPQKNAKVLPIQGKERKTRSQLKAQLQNVKVPQQSSHKDQLVKKLSIKDSNSKTDDMNRGGHKTVKPPAPQMNLLVRMQQNFENDVDADAQTHNDLDIGEKQRSLTDNPNNLTKTNELNSDSSSYQTDTSIEVVSKSTNTETPKKSDKETLLESSSTPPKSPQDNGNDSGSDDDESDMDMDGLLIPLENGWVCEKRLLGEEERKQRDQELELQRRRRGRSAADDEFAAMR